MENIVVLFGGSSVEHDISVLTGLHAARNILDDKNVYLVYLTRDGRLVTSGSVGYLSKLDFYIKNTKTRKGECYFSQGNLYRSGGIFGRKKVCRVDAVLNCCHGGAGEDGRLAGMLEMFDIPVTSCDYIVGATLQSKIRTREILEKAGFAQPIVYEDHGKVTFPAIVKPDTLGSSIGITVVHDEDELKNALELAYTLDKSVIVEQFLENATEINCSAFRHQGKVHASECEHIKNNAELYGFDDKYLGAIDGESKKSGDIVPEQVPYVDEVRALTKRAYELFGCRGVVRMDFLIANDIIYLNEVNTVPGFLAYHLWQKSGTPYGALINMLVEQSAKDHKKDLKTSFSSEILQKNRSLVE